MGKDIKISGFDCVEDALICEGLANAIKEVTIIEQQKIDDANKRNQNQLRAEEKRVGKIREELDNPALKNICGEILGVQKEPSDEEILKNVHFCEDDKGIKETCANILRANKIKFESKQPKNLEEVFEKATASCKRILNNDDVDLSEVFEEIKKQVDSESVDDDQTDESPPSDIRDIVNLSEEEQKLLADELISKAIENSGKLFEEAKNRKYCGAEPPRFDPSNKWRESVKNFIATEVIKEDGGIDNEAIDAFMKMCAKDPIYFIETCVGIPSPLRGTISFDLYPYQKDLVKKFQTEESNVILKSRQIGMSTIMRAYSLWFMLFNSDKNIWYITANESSSNNFIKRVINAYESIPYVFKEVLPKIILKSKNGLRFDNKSDLCVSRPTKYSGCGQPVDLLIMDEVDYSDNFIEIYEAVRIGMNDNGKVIVSGTPNDPNGDFKRLYDKLGEKTIHLDWKAVPSRTQRWFDDQTKFLSKRSIETEYLGIFPTKEESVQPKTILLSVLKEKVQEIDKIISQLQELKRNLLNQ